MSHHILCFLFYNKSLYKLNLPNLERCGYVFLYKNQCLQELSLPNLKEYGSGFVDGRFDDVIDGTKKLI